MTAAAKLPRGIRNNNPGNIEWGDPWQGLLLIDERTDERFCQFVDPSWGIRALARVLITYQDKRRAADGSAIDTVTEIIYRWAPPNENDTEAYIAAVCEQTGFREDEIIDLHCYDDARPLVEAIIRHECGRGPLKTANTWYSDAVIDVALQRAGVVRCAKEVASVPVTKETLGATATGALGAAQIAEVLPAVMDATTRAEDHITSGSWVRMAFGVLTIGIAVYIAWAQVRKYQDGVIA